MSPDKQTVDKTNSQTKKHRLKKAGAGFMLNAYLYDTTGWTDRLVQIQETAPRVSDTHEDEPVESQRHSKL
ncbi:hypothetical protein MGN70_011752 [Eutypa lata]|nr:hypothetical protein MGN70_011752 [Eutypa lata]